MAVKSTQCIKHKQEKATSDNENASSPPKRAKKGYKQTREKDDVGARMAVASGQVARVEEGRRRQRDACTLYLRFNHVTELPTDPADVARVHEDISEVRVARRNRDQTFSYCFVQFEDVERCEKAKEELNHKVFRDGTLFVDRVGARDKKEKVGNKVETPRNMKRLFVSGNGGRLTVKEVKDVFKNAVYVHIPTHSVKKGKAYAFVQFDNEADAKSAFEQMQQGTQWTVLYAKIDKRTIKEQRKENNERNSTKRGNEEEDLKGAKKAKGNEDKKEEEKKENKEGKKGKADKVEEEEDFENDSEDDGEEEEVEEGNEDDDEEDGEEDDGDEEGDDDDEEDGEGDDDDDDEEEEEDKNDEEN